MMVEPESMGGRELLSVEFLLLCVQGALAHVISARKLFMECCRHPPHFAEKETGSESPGSAEI